AEAVKWYRNAAEQGQAFAQTNLGRMYEKGNGVLQDSSAAADWYRKAAEQGYARAQHNIGVLYVEGRGVPQDYVTAYMWFNLAAAKSPDSPDEDRAAALKNRDRIASRMTLAEIAEAQRRSLEWKPVRGR
ncbi:MAG: sel1 repeat family protein, partial [Deltaproteobacteria bacterium]|nr:sel1 repeat family protein [Deltaproteobacteria bacterium]